MLGIRPLALSLSAAPVAPAGTQIGAAAVHNERENDEDDEKHEPTNDEDDEDDEDDANGEDDNDQCWPTTLRRLRITRESSLRGFPTTRANGTAPLTTVGGR